MASPTAIKRLRAPRLLGGFMTYGERRAPTKRVVSAFFPALRAPRGIKKASLSRSFADAPAVPVAARCARHLRSSRQQGE